MVFILPNNQRPRFAERLNQGIQQALPVAQNFLNHLQQQKQVESENQKLAQLGYDVGGISSKEGRNAIFEGVNKERQSNLSHQNRLAELAQENQIKDRIASEKENKANQEKLAPFETGLKSIAAMRQILKRGNLGLLSGAKGIFHPKTREDRAKYQQLGKSLISLASNIPIRNKAEFETLAENLYNPNNTDETNKAILDAMEQLIQSNMQPFMSGNLQQEPQQNISQVQKNKPPLISFLR